MIRAGVTRAAAFAERISLWVAGIGTAYMLAVVAFNVVARQIFDLTGGAIALMIPGAIEQASYALLVVVLASITASIRTGPITVDLVIARLPAPARRAATRFWYLVLGLFAATLAWLFGQEAVEMASRGDILQDLRLPLYPFYAVASLEAAGLGLVCLSAALTPPGDEKATLA